MGDLSPKSMEKLRQLTAGRKEAPRSKFGLGHGDFTPIPSRQTLAAMAREHTEDALNVVLWVMQGAYTEKKIRDEHGQEIIISVPTADASLRHQAALSILDRGHGKPRPMVDDDSGDGQTIGGMRDILDATRRDQTRREAERAADAYERELQREAPAEAPAPRARKPKT